MCIYDASSFALSHDISKKCDVPEVLQRIQCSRCCLMNMEIFMFEDMKLNGDRHHVWKCKHTGNVTFRRRWICVLVLGPMFRNGNILETCLCRRRWIFVLVSQHIPDTETQQDFQKKPYQAGRHGLSWQWFRVTKLHHQHPQTNLPISFRLNSPRKCYKSHMIIRVLIKHNIQSKCRSGSF